LLFGFSRTLDLGQVFYWMDWISQDKFRFSGSGSLVFGFSSASGPTELDNWIRALTLVFFHRIIEK
jgi:hypothetical protein